jgi:hypothetical protein
MEDRQIRAALDRHWAASDANDLEGEHQIYREDAVLESAGGARFSRLAPRSRTGNASQCGGLSARATSGSPNLS